MWLIGFVFVFVLVSVFVFVFVVWVLNKVKIHKILKYHEILEYLKCLEMSRILWLTWCVHKVTREANIKQFPFLPHMVCIPFLVIYRMYVIMKRGGVPLLAESPRNYLSTEYKIFFKVAIYKAGFRQSSVYSIIRNHRIS